MKPPATRPLAFSAAPVTESVDGQSKQALELPYIEAILAVACKRRAAALDHGWELGEQRYTAEECSTMSLRRLRRLCDEAFAALDSDFPAWGALDEYKVLSAEITTRVRSQRTD